MSSIEQDTPPADERARPERLMAPIPEARGQLLHRLERYGLLVIFVVILVVFSIIANGFFTLDNFRIVLGTQSVLAMLGLSAIVPLISGQFDLSIGSNLGATTIVIGTCMSRFHLEVWVAVLLGLVFSVLVGLVNGYLVAYMGVSSFIITLAMATFLEGIVQWYTAGAAISQGISQGLVNWSTGDLLGIPKGLLWLVPVALVLYYTLSYTPYGRYLTSIGSNANAARLVGLPVKRYVMSTFAVAGGLAGLAAVLTVGQAGDADPQSVLGPLLLPALAAAFLGSSAFTPGRFNVRGTILAVYFVAFSVSGLEFLGAQSWVNQVFDGLALAGAVTVTTVIARRSKAA